MHVPARQSRGTQGLATAEGRGPRHVHQARRQDPQRPALGRAAAGLLDQGSASRHLPSGLLHRRPAIADGVAPRPAVQRVAAALPARRLRRSAQTAYEPEGDFDVNAIPADDAPPEAPAPAAEVEVTSKAAADDKSDDSTEDADATATTESKTEA